MKYNICWNFDFDETKNDKKTMSSWSTYSTFDSKRKKINRYNKINYSLIKEEIMSTCLAQGKRWSIEKNTTQFFFFTKINNENLMQTHHGKEKWIGKNQTGSNFPMTSKLSWKGRLFSVLIGCSYSLNFIHNQKMKHANIKL